MGYLIGDATSGAHSTWAQVRCPLIGGYDQYDSVVGPGSFPHNLIVDSGFHADEGYFLRVINWPQTSTWFDTNSNPHTEYAGPFVGWNDGGGVSPYDSYFSVGAYDANINDTTNPVYTSVNHNLDETDVADSLVGLTVTYTSGTFTTTADAFEQAPASTPWFGQDIGVNAISAVTDISTFTAF